MTVKSTALREFQCIPALLGQPGKHGIVHPFHRPCNSFVGLPAWLLDVIEAERARDIRSQTRPHNPLPCFSREVLRCGIVFSAFWNFTVLRFALVKAHGFGLLPAGGRMKGASWTCPPCRWALTIPARRTVQTKTRKKTNGRKGRACPVRACSALGFRAYFQSWRDAPYDRYDRIGLKFARLRVHYYFRKG